MCHFLAGLFSSWFAGCSRDKPDLAHLGRPLFIMIALSRWFSKVVLPQVYHFVCEGRENLIWFPRGKVDWIKRDLVSYFFRVGSVGKALAGEVAESTFMSLHRYQARRQTT